MSGAEDLYASRLAFADRAVQRLQAEGFDQGAAVEQVVAQVLPNLTDAERHELALRELTHIIRHAHARIERGEPRAEAIEKADDDASACSLGPDLCPLEDSA